jgi:ADP-ribosyl-[dinitrogen reductase] hydrolase
MTKALATDAPDDDRARAAFLGSLIADAISLPVHWYYDRAALDRDYPELLEPADTLGYLPPRSPHPDSILWRSSYVAAGPQFDILGDQAQFWGRRGVHYHQQLPAGGSTLNFQLARELYGLLRRDRDYDPERWIDHYVAFMRQPERHGDTYVEEYHRHFFTNLAAGRKPINCGVSDVHIGGLAHVPAIVAGLGPRHPDLRRIVRVHVSLTHKDDDVLAAADAFVRMLARLTRPDRTADDLRTVVVEEASDWVSAAKLADWNRRCAATGGACPDRGVVGAVLSPACYIDEAFPASLFLACSHADDFAEGVRANALCGGDNCHRGAVVGALLGATAPIPHRLLAELLAQDTLSISQGF